MTDIHPKITDHRQIQPSESGKAKPRPKKDHHLPFDKILSQEMKPAETRSDSVTSSRLSELEGAFRAGQIKPMPLDKSEISRKLTASLDLFEQYAAFLGDPDKSLKQTYTLLEQVLAQTRALAGDMDQKQGLTPEQDELKTIVAQLLTTARVEQIKFDRGDYL